MPEVLTRADGPDRLRIFVSSTIGECARERAAARSAILKLNFVPIQFEREGARAEPPREFYLRKLQDSHIVVAIYRNSYGWVDEAKGMRISGLEDEYREACRLGKDILAYVAKTAPDRDPRLARMLEEIKSGPVIYFFEEGEDLEARIRDDLTAYVTDRVTDAQRSRPGAGSASAVLDAIYKGTSLRIRRTSLLLKLSEMAALSRTIWITGEAGVGKTALIAEWAHERGAAYVNARGLDPRSTILAVAEALGIATGAELAIPMFEDARALLRARWRAGANWPLVVDDPEDLHALWSVLGACVAENGVGMVMIATREVAEHFPGARFEVSGFTDPELSEIRAMAGFSESLSFSGNLPLSLREDAREARPSDRFASLDAVSREALGYLALSPVPLTLEDLGKLLGSAGGTATELSASLGRLDMFLMESPAGYDFVHDVLRADAQAVIASRTQLNALILERLSKLLARSGRAWAAFRLRAAERSSETERLANRAVREAIFSGSMRHLAEALEFLTDFYRSREEHGPLVSVLIGLAEARVNQGLAYEAPAVLAEALEVARSIGDREAEQTINILHASLELRRFASEKALERVRTLRLEAEREGRAGDQARLLLEEATAFLGFNETQKSIPLYREAAEIFESLGDKYGVEIARRNLIVSLASSNDGVAEAEALRASLDKDEPASPRYRAWLCNLLVPRLRREKKFQEAEAMAREAIGIAEELGDRYLTAINQIGLGNVLRDAGDLDGARLAYGESGRIAQSVGRPDIEGRSSRLLAVTENSAAEDSEGSERVRLATLAEQYATHAIALLANSFAWSEHATALEERGDALRLQGRDSDAAEDYARAVSGFLRADEEEDGARLLRYMLCSGIADRAQARLIAAAFDVDTGEMEPSEEWVQALRAALPKCPRTVAPLVMGSLVRSFLPANQDRIWFDCLVRCLLAIESERSGTFARRSGLGSVLLLAILGYSPHRNFRDVDLFALAGLCMSGSDKIAIRHRPGSDLDIILHLGTEKRMLFTLRTEAQAPEAIFIVLVIGAFLDAFASELSEILTPNLFEEGIALDTVVFSQSVETDRLRKFFASALRDKPVAAARMTPNPGEEAPVILIARVDAMEQLVAKADRGGELEILFARFLDEVIFATIGKGVDDAIFSSKIRDLLMSVLG
jgi:tetratricopeptide (TPR) repeat protein